MVKPTLFQTVFNRPSRSYTLPSENQSQIPRARSTAIPKDIRRAHRKASTVDAGEIKSNGSASGSQSRYSASLSTSSGGGRMSRARNAEESGIELSMEIQRAAKDVPITHVPSSHASTLSIASSTSTATYHSTSHSKENISSSGRPEANNPVWSGHQKPDNHYQDTEIPSLVAAPAATAIPKVILTTHTQPLNSIAPGGKVRNLSEDDDGDEEEEDDDSIQDGDEIFYTPNTSPRTSFASAASTSMSYSTTTTMTTARKVSGRSLRHQVGNGNGSPLAQEFQHPHPSPPPKDTRYSPMEEEDAPGASERVKSGPSPSSKPSSSGSTTVKQSSTRSLSVSKPPPPPSTTIPTSTAAARMTNATTLSSAVSASTSTWIAVPSTRTPSRSNSLRTTVEYRAVAGRAAHPDVRSVASASSSMSSTSLDGHSLFSDFVTTETDSTRVTTPGLALSDEQMKAKKKTTTPAPTTKRENGSATTSKITATGDDMKSTVTPIQRAKSNRQQLHPKPNDGMLPIPTTSQHRPNKAHTYGNIGSGAVPSAHYQHQRNVSKQSQLNPSIMMNMAALMEVEEEDRGLGFGPSAGAGATWEQKGKMVAQHPKSNVIISEPMRAKPRSPPVQMGPSSGSSSSGYDRNGDGSPRSTTRSSPSSPSRPRQYERDDSLTSVPAVTDPSPSSSSRFLSPPRARLARRRSRSLGLESTPTRSDTLSSSPYSRGSRTFVEELAVLPRSSGELPSNGTPGYTSLVVPRAPPPLNFDAISASFASSSSSGIGKGKGKGKGRAMLDNLSDVVVAVSGGGDGKVDLTKNGLAQATMASVEVVRGLGGIRKGPLGGVTGLLARRTTMGATAGKVYTAHANEESSSRTEEIAKDSASDERGGGNAGRILGFTSYRNPPEYVPSGCVLVQIWAVGVDGVDGRLVGVKMLQGGPTLPGSANTSPAVPSVELLGQPQQQDEGDEGGDNKKGKGKFGGGLGRSLSLREKLSRSVSLGRASGKETARRRASPPRHHSPEKDKAHSATVPAAAIANVGFVPGRSFVGRVVECGWEVRGEIIRKGEWVAGLLDIKKCGALTEFIVVDRHKVHRVPHPQKLTARSPAVPTFSPPLSATSFTPIPHTLTLEELALLPLCGVPAYRAVRTFLYAFSSVRDNVSSVAGDLALATSKRAEFDPHKPLNFATYGKMPSRSLLPEHENSRRRRVLVLRGHDGIGAMAVQMLVLRGWRVCVHVPFIASPPTVPTTPAIADRFMEEVEERIRNWGAEEVIFDDGEVVGCDEGRGAVVRVIEGLLKDGDVFDAILDTIGGKEIREVSEKLLRSVGRVIEPEEGQRVKVNSTKGMGQFTTIVGDNPERPIPSAGDLFRAGIRSLKFGSNSVAVHEKISETVNTVGGSGGKGGKVGYAWVNISQDVDWEGKDIGETIGSVLDLAVEYGIKPWVGAESATWNDATHNGPGRTTTTAKVSSALKSVERSTTEEGDTRHWEGKRIVPFEKAPDVFVDGGPLSSGGTVVVKIAA